MLQKYVHVYAYRRVLHEQRVFDLRTYERTKDIPLHRTDRFWTETRSIPEGIKSYVTECFMNGKYDVKHVAKRPTNSMNTVNLIMYSNEANILCKRKI